MKKLVYFILLLCLGFYALTPDISQWLKQPFTSSSIIYSADHKPLYWQGPPYRKYVKFEQIPTIMIEAIRTTEDHRFFFHDGIDWIALVRAIKHLVRTGRKDIGASTITMQLARNSFLSSEKNYSRKLKELIIAVKLDALLSKKQIMELYLNRIYLGQGSYGIAAAAWRYYGKSLDQLTLAETAMIAGLPQAPSKNNPIVRAKKAKLRRNFVLKKLLKHKVISQSEFITASNSNLTVKLHKWPKNPKYQNLIKRYKALYLPPRAKYDSQ